MVRLRKHSKQCYIMPYGKKSFAVYIIFHSQFSYFKLQLLTSRQQFITIPHLMRILKKLKCFLREQQLRATFQLRTTFQMPDISSIII